MPVFVFVFVHSILGKLERAMYTFQRRTLYTEVYKDRDILFYLSYYHCLQTVKKGSQLCYYLIEFKKVVPMTSLAKLNTQWVSNNSLMDMNTITTHYDTRNAWSKGKVSFVCLKMSKQMKRKKKYSWQCFYFVVKVKYTFVLSI